MTALLNGAGMPEPAVAELVRACLQVFFLQLQSLSIIPTAAVS